MQAKSEIFDYMAEDGEICLNGGDDKLSELISVKGHTPHFFGLGENPKEEVSALNIEGRGLWGSDARLIFRDSAIRTGGELADCPDTGIMIHVPQPGVHMVRNAAAAACVGRLLGLTPEEIAAGVSKVSPVSGRNNLIRLDGYTLIDDCYNANPASMKAALDLLSMSDTEKIAILGDMFELGENSHRLHAEIGEYAAKAGLRELFCVGEEARHMYEAAKKAGGIGEIHYFPTRAALLEALERAGKEFPKDCTVLVKASHGMGFSAVVELLRRVRCPEVKN